MQLWGYEIPLAFKLAKLYEFKNNALMNIWESNPFFSADM